MATAEEKTRGELIEDGRLAIAEIQTAEVLRDAIFGAALTREEWLVERRKGIGASEAAAAIGVSPYKSTIELWAEKCGLVEPPDLSGNEPLEFGVRLEPVIIDAYAARSGRKVWPHEQHKVERHPQHPFLLCTPDAWQVIDDKEGLVQVKTAGAFVADEWRDGPPLHYEVQCQMEMLVTGTGFNTVVVLIGGQKLRYFDLERNERFLAALVAKLTEFWRCVETRTPPAVDHSQACARALLRLHPSDSGDTVDLPVESDNWASELEEAKLRAKELEDFIRERENKLKSSIADASFGVTPSGVRFSWKHQARAGYVVKPSEFRVLRRLKK